MEQRYIIRHAERKDMHQLVELCSLHAAYEESDYDSENKVFLLESHLFVKNSSLNCLVVELKGELIGYATFTKQFSTWDANYYVYMDCLYLKEEARRKGIGQELMSKIKSFAKIEKCNVIQWQTPKSNHSAIKFYNSIGAVGKAKERFFWEV